VMLLTFILFSLACLVFGITAGDSDAESVTTPTRQSLWNQMQEQLFQQMGEKAQTGMAEGPTAYPREMFVGKTPEEQAYLDSVSKAYSSGNMEARVAAVNQLLSGKAAYNIDPTVSENFYQQSIKPEYMKQFSETTLPGIKQAFTGPGYWGSARAGAEGDAYGDLATTLGSKRAELAYKDEEARRASLESAAGRQTTMATTPNDTVAGATGAMGTAGTYARNIAQEKVTADLQRWLMGETVDGKRSDAYNPYIQLALSLMGLSPYAIANQSESESGGWNAGIGKAGSGGSGGASAGGTGTGGTTGGG
jgi:hypothetical protein